MLHSFPLDISDTDFLVMCMFSFNPVNVSFLHLHVIYLSDSAYRLPLRGNLCPESNLTSFSLKKYFKTYKHILSFYQNEQLSCR